MKDEMDALRALHVIDMLVERNVVNLKGRIREFKVPNGASQIGMMTHCVNTLYENILKTVPLEQLVNLKNDLKMSSYSIGTRRPGMQDVRDRELGMFLSWEQVKTMYKAIDEGTCRMCDRDKQEQRQCPMRKCLDLIPNDVEDRADGMCPYMWL